MRWFPAMKSSLEHIIAQGLPATNEILFLRAASARPRDAIVRMKMCRSICNGILQRHVTFKPLMKVAGLRNVHRRPIAVGQLSGVNVNARQGSEDCAKRVYLELVLLAG